MKIDETVWDVMQVLFMAILAIISIALAVGLPLGICILIWKLILS